MNTFLSFPIYLLKANSNFNQNIKFILEPKPYYVSGFAKKTIFKDGAY